MDVVGLEGQAWGQNVVDADACRPGRIAVHVLHPGILGTDAEWTGFIDRSDIPLPIYVIVPVELSETAAYGEFGNRDLDTRHPGGEVLEIRPVSVAVRDR